MSQASVSISHDTDLPSRIIAGVSGDYWGVYAVLHAACPSLVLQAATWIFGFHGLTCFVKAYVGL